MLTGVAGKEHVVLRLVTGLVARRRAESATCSRRHAVNLVPLDEFALGGYCFHAVAHVCLCHGAHRRALALPAARGWRRAFQGGWRANASEPTRGLNARTTRDDAARKNVRCVVGLRAPPATPGTLTPPSPHKNGVGTLGPNLNRLSPLVPCGKG